MNDGFHGLLQSFFLRRGFLAILIVFLTVSFTQLSLAQICPDTNPETDSQLGCPDPFYTAVSKPVMSRGFMEFNITFRNRKIAFLPDCAPGECYDNINFQGLPLCQGWSGKFTGVKVELASCNPVCDLEGCPDCDFNVTITPSGPQDIESGKSSNYTVRINAFATEGDYDFTFRALLSSVKKRIISLRMNISSQVSGIEGDNYVCPICSSEKCDTQRLSCGYSCPSAIYCSAPECLFDTPFTQAAEYCCGDDAGEVFRQCSKTGEIDWTCPSQNACCESSASCVYSGNCYGEGVHMLAGGEDEYSYCYMGRWYDCDESLSICSECGFSWNSSECCGDDGREYFRSRICFSGCETNMTDKSCCTLGSACVYEGKCYATGDIIVLGGKNVTCEGGSWSEKTNETVCYKGECNKRDRCEGMCPGCIFKDFSCYGSNCGADYIDPDMHWAYCGNCSLNWSGKQCCGDDEKEYWVPPCPNTSSSWGCCSNPNERMGKNGECVISCGTAIGTSVAVLEEALIPLTVSLSPEVIELESGKTAEFEVILRSDGNQSLHNVVLDLCGPFSFESSPQEIEELMPGESKSFTVRVTAPPDSVIGALNFAAYVSSSELIRQRYRPGLVNVSMAGLPSYDIFIWIILALIAAYIARKLISRRKPAGKPGKEEGPKQKKGRDAARRRLVNLVREELDKGTPEKKLRKVLTSNGISKGDIEAAFAEAKENGQNRT